MDLFNHLAIHKLVSNVTIGSPTGGDPLVRCKGLHLHEGGPRQVLEEGVEVAGGSPARSRSTCLSRRELLLVAEDDGFQITVEEAAYDRLSLVSLGRQDVSGF